MKDMKNYIVKLKDRKTGHTCISHIRALSAEAVNKLYDGSVKQVISLQEAEVQ